MSEFTRLTIIATARKAEVVIPNDESIGGLIPRLMDLLGEPPTTVARPLTLVRGTGEQLDTAQSAGDQEVADGELLRLVRTDDAPPPPEVADVTDVLAESHRDRPGLWSARSREITGSVVIGGLTCLATLLGRPELTALAVAVGVLLLAALALGRIGARWANVALTAAALGTVPGLALGLVSLRGPLEAAGGPLVLAVAAGLAWVVLGVGFGLGARRRAATYGSLAGLLLAALPVLLVGLGVFGLGAVGVTGVVAVVGCGLLPWYAMTASGLTGLDDQVVEGRPRRRGEVIGTVQDAYRTLSWTTFAVAIPIAACVAVLGSSDNRWAAGLALALVLVTTLRTRAFPLAAEQMPLWFAATAGTAYAIARSPLLSPTSSALALVGLGLFAAIAVGLRPASHQRASLRRFGSLLEALAMIALIPVALGLFGLYTDLLGAFR